MSLVTPMRFPVKTSLCCGKSTETTELQAHNEHLHAVQSDTCVSVYHVYMA